MDALSSLVPCTLVFICIPPGQVFYLKGLGQSERPLPVGEALFLHRRQIQDHTQWVWRTYPSPVSSSLRL